MSDIKGDKTLDVIAELIEPVSNIATDDKLLSMLKDAKGSDEADVKAKLAKLAPIAIRSHKSDVIAILAAIKCVNVEEYVDGLNLATLIGDLVELLNDEEFASFFISSVRTS